MGFLTHCKLSSLSLHTLSHEPSIFFSLFFFARDDIKRRGEIKALVLIFFFNGTKKKIIYYASLLRLGINIKSHAPEVNAIISFGLKV